jgi:tetratricopeptide (TPR) repeat protein
LHQSEVGPDPYLADAYSQVGTILEQLDRPHEALAAYEEAVLNDPTEDRAHLGMGNIHLRFDEPLLAIAAYRQAVDISPTKSNEYFLLGDAYLQVGELQEAVAAYQEALGIRPDHPQARRRLELLSSAFDEDIPSPPVRSLGFQMGLLGYGIDSESARAGTTVEVSLWWLALARMDKDYTAFIHLTDEEGRLWAQDDRVIEDSGLLTSTWTPAAAVKQAFQVQLSPDLPPGVYTFSVGVYYWETGERLTVWEEDGQGSPANTIPLDTIAITQ